MKTKLRKCIRRIIAFVSVFVIGFSAMSLNAFAADFIAGADYNGDGVHQGSELKSEDCDFRSLYGQNGSQYATNLFWFYDPDNYSDYYPGLCIQTLNTAPNFNQGYKIYERVDRNDSKVIAYYYLLGSGVTTCNAKDYSFEQRVVIAHTVIAILSGDTTWNGNNAQHTWNLFGTEGSTWYNFIMDWVAWCKNSKIPDSMGAKGWLVSPEGEGTSGIQNMFIYDEWNRGWIKIQKSSSDPVLSAGNSSYSLAGAVYGVYKDAACTNKVDEITTNSSGWGECKDWHDYGTYYVKEISAPKGYKLDSTVYSATIDNSSGNTIYVSDAPFKGWVKLQKSSSNPVLSAGNSSYSLAGAVYGVYKDAACTNKVDEITTNSSGWGECKDWHGYGTYYVKEISAPKGFELDTTVYAQVINCETGNTVNVSDVPETDPVTILLRKVNKETGGVSNGDGTLKGAKYVVKYYDTDMTTDPAAAGRSAKYTWYVQTDKNGRVDLSDEDCYIDGDNLFIVNGLVSFPLGTITVGEIEAPTGYIVDNTLFVTNLFNKKVYVNGEEQKKATSYQEADDTIIQMEQEIKGKVTIRKTKTTPKDDNSKVILSTQKEELTKKVAEEGAVFQLYLKSAGNYDNAEDSVRDILTTDKNGLATSKNLPYGNYVLHQIVGDENCIFMEDMEVSITENGKTYELAGNDVQKYSKIRLYKMGEVLTGFDQTTGFKYEKGYVGGCTYAVYSDPSFSNESLIEQITTVNGTYAESRYEYKPGTYYIKEVSTNGQYLLDPEVHEITITADNYAEVSFTNITMEDIRQKVNISVNKSDVDTGDVLANTIFGVYATTDIKDRSGNVVVSAGTLLEKLVTGEDGTAATNFDYPTGYVYEVKELTSPIGYGNKHDTKEVDTSEIKGNSESQDHTLKYTDKHTSIAGTKAAEYKTGDNQGAYDENFVYRIIDSVDCRDLVVGEEYTIKGMLKDKATGLPFVDMDGNTVTGETTFTAETEDQIVNVEFNFKANLEGMSVVVAERLYQQGVEIFVHDDLEDKNQTIDYLKLRTKAHDKDTLTNVGTVSDKASIVDEVMFNNLRVGNTYEVSGYLMNKDTGVELLDKDGNKITATKTFTAETPDQTVEMEFTFDSSLLQGITVTVFEDAYYNGVKVGLHCDINSEDQSIFYPEIKTTANDGVSGTKYNNGAEDIVIVDTVSLKNLIVGKEYVIKGVLKDKATGKSIINKATGKEITGEVKFTAEQKDVSVDVTFNFKRADLAGRTIVCFEKLYHNEIEVAVHEDLSDEGQTIVEPTKFGIIKIDGTSKLKKPLVGATLQILDKDGKVVEVEILTETKDENGNMVTTVKKATSFVSGIEETIIVGLEPGTYKIHEVEAPWGYNLTDDVMFVLGDKVELQHFTISDDAKLGLMKFSYDEKKDYEVAADSDFVAPQTGDSLNVLRYVVIMLVSGIVLFGCLFGKNKKAFIKVFGAVFVFLAIAFAGNNKTYAATTFTEEEEFESEDKEATYDFKANKLKDGVNYTLIDVKYDVKAKQIANITKTSTVLVTDAAPEFEESIVENGITYTLKSVTTAEGDMGSRSVTYTKVYTYNGLTKTNDIPSTVDGNVRDEVTNEISTVNMSQSDLVKRNEQKSDDFVFPINVVSGAYFMYKDNLVEYDAENPNLMQYKDSILEDLGLSKDIYTVESIEWSSDPEVKEDGMIHRKATVKGYKEIADYEATYTATVDYPTTNVVYTADYEADTTKNTTFYEIKGTATYQLTSEIVDENASGTNENDFKSVFKNPVVVGSFSAVVIVIIAVIAAVLWKKKSEKEVVE